MNFVSGQPSGDAVGVAVSAGQCLIPDWRSENKPAPRPLPPQESKLTIDMARPSRIFYSP